jgi:hypothetical protein
MMMRIILFILAALNARVSVSQSPIVLGNANMPGMNDTLRYTNVQMNSLGNYQQTGEGHFWDFSKVVSLGQGLRFFQSAAQTPYPFYFFGTNEYGEKVADTLGAGPFIVTNYYNYYRKLSGPLNAFIADGAAITFSGIPVPLYYTDKDELYILPLTYGNRDSSTFRFATPNTTLMPIRYTKTGYRITEVDGWGVVSTPYGTEECIRLVTTQYAMDTIMNNLIPIPIGYPNHVRSYQWMTLNSKIPFFEVSGNYNRLTSVLTPTAVRYRGYERPELLSISKTLNTRFSVFPNPVSDYLCLRGEAGQAIDYELMSVTGVAVGSGVSYAGECIGTSDLRPGLYFLRGMQDGRTFSCKFIKE